MKCCREPIRHALQALLALNWQVEYSESSASAATASAGAGGSQRQMQQQSSADQKNPHNYHPSPADLTNLTLSKEMMNLAER